MKSTSRILCLLLAAVLLMALFPAAALAEPMDTRTLATINKPSVVIVWTTWTATMTLREFSFNDSLFETLEQQVAQLVSQGKVPNDNNAIYSALVQLMIQQMGEHAFYTGNTETQQVSTSAFGTGSFITPDGYLITNAHVVESDEDQLYYSFAVSNLQSLASEVVTAYIEEFRRQGYQMTQDEVDGLYNAMYSLLSKSMKITNLQTSFECIQGNVQPGSDVSIKGVMADVRKVGVPASSKDVAILKVNGSNFPTVTLGDDTEIRTGDTIFVYGYPGVATTSGVVDKTQAMQEPTMTQGIVSARKLWEDGGNIIQYDAATSGGNSGGPVFNAEGEVIGIHTFGLNDPNTGGRMTGYAFCVPISTVKTYLNELNVTPSESKFTADFKAALSAYNNGDYHTALELVRGINETNPGYPVVQELLADARRAADANPQPAATPEPAEADGAKEPDAAVEAFSADNKPSGQSDTILGMPPVVVYVLAGVIILAIAAVLVLVMRKKRPAMANSAPQPFGMPPPPQTGQFQPPPPVIAASEATIACSECGASLSPGEKFCDNCGAPAEKPAPGVCEQCGATLKPGAKFCNGCGTKVN